MVRHGTCQPGPGSRHGHGRPHSEPRSGVQSEPLKAAAAPVDAGNPLLDYLGCRYRRLSSHQLSCVSWEWQDVQPAQGAQASKGASGGSDNL